MTANARRILFLPGDGIGPEVMEQVRRVIGWLSRRDLGFELEEDLVGGAAFDRHGTPLADFDPRPRPGGRHRHVRRRRRTALRPAALRPEA